jgi:ankyrin repeat protein
MNIEERINAGFRRLSQTAKDWSNPTPEEMAAARLELARRREDGGTLLHDLAREGQLGEASILLTPDLLQMTDAKGDSVVLVAASSGYLGQIPANLLTKELLGFHNGFGWTLAHAAALTKTLDQLPAGRLTLDLLQMTDAIGVSVIATAAWYGCLDQIPRHLLTEQMLAYQVKGGETPVHKAADRGTLYVIADLLTRKLLTIPDRTGTTPIHLAARKGCLDQIPPHLIDGQMLAARDQDDQTPVHKATVAGIYGRQWGPLDQILTLLPEMTDEDAAKVAGLIYERVPAFVQEHFDTFPPRTQAIFVAHMLAA